MIPLTAVSADQLQKIRNHIELGKELGIDFATEMNQWTISENQHAVEGWTSMDNFNMDKFLKLIGVPEDFVHWEHCG